MVLRGCGKWLIGAVNVGKRSHIVGDHKCKFSVCFGILFSYNQNYVCMHHGFMHYHRPLAGPLVNHGIARKMLSSFLPFAKEKAPLSFSSIKFA